MRNVSYGAAASDERGGKAACVDDAENEIRLSIRLSAVVIGATSSN